MAWVVETDTTHHLFNSVDLHPILKRMWQYGSLSKQEWRIGGEMKILLCLNDSSSSARSVTVCLRVGLGGCGGLWQPLFPAFIRPQSKSGGRGGRRRRRVRWSPPARRVCAVVGHSLLFTHQRNAVYPNWKIPKGQGIHRATLWLWLCSLKILS